jgi:CPA2 family monovalent cation:H+ antiporter-2
VKDIIHLELEGGLEIVRYTLLRLGLPLQEITRYTDAVRQDHYDFMINTEEEHQMLRDLLSATSSIEITWLEITPGNSLVGQTLAEANLRARTGASVIAIIRNKQLLANPKSLNVLR